MGLKIVAVDDDPVSLALLQGLLTESGHDVSTASNGREAIDFLQSNQANLLVSDWMMPEVNGIELCKWIRQQSFSSYLYVIMLTSRNEREDLLTGLAAGADEFLGKPVDPEELNMRIRTAERILSLESRDVTIFSMARLAESRDPETGHHLERIREYVRVISDQLQKNGLFADEVTAGYGELLYQTSPLHDIGKVGIPDSILLKPGRLTDEEFNIMKTHTIVGRDTIEAALRQYPDMQYLRLARDIAVSHHERYNGSGYPDGVRGDDIPLCGRITALADVYDALVSQRVYKDAFSPSVARDMILDERGKHFDERIVDSFEEAEHEIRAVLVRFTETAEVAAPQA